MEIREIIWSEMLVKRIEKVNSFECIFLIKACRMSEFRVSFLIIIKMKEGSELPDSTSNVPVKPNRGRSNRTKSSEKNCRGRPAFNSSKRVSSRQRELRECLLKSQEKATAVLRTIKKQQVKRGQP